MRMKRLSIKQQFALGVAIGVLYVVVRMVI